MLRFPAHILFRSNILFHECRHHGGKMTKTLERVLKDATPVVKTVIEESLKRFSNDVVDEIVALDKDAEDQVRRLTRHPELRWKYINTKHRFRCPECGNRMYSDCSRYTCSVCGEVTILKSPVLFDICKQCVSYKDGCPGNQVSIEPEPIMVKTPAKIGESDV